MKILMLVNWKIEYCDTQPADKQPPDYYVKGEPYWFFRYFKEQPDVDVVDISSFPWLEKFEKNKLRFYIWQTLKVLPKLDQYDLIVSHGMQSGVVLSLWRRLFKGKAKHVVFDIGSFNSAAESGFALKLMQFASKSIDGLIYHTSSQKGYYQRFFPWLVDRSKFISFGTDLELLDNSPPFGDESRPKYCICIGYADRDWDTVVQSYNSLNTDVRLYLVGHVNPKYEHISGVYQFPAVSFSELNRLICEAKLGILPLEWRNYSYGQMTLLQQMALGKCVIAARVPSLVDYIEDGKTAILYEPKNADDLAEKMSTALNDPIKCQVIAHNAQKWLRDQCNEKTMAAEIEAFIAALKQE